MNQRPVAGLLLLYFVPAFLYCLYNNLAFVNLSAFDPTTYYLLLQFRVVVTGIVFQVLFQNKLSGKQWLSLILLTVGCMVKQIDISSLYSSSTVSPTAHSNSLWEFRLSVNALLILVQGYGGGRRERRGWKTPTKRVMYSLILECQGQQLIKLVLNGGEYEV
uniref:Uncharacterized protein n=1 Tax=Timema tahoe TaxID=61484 RepID=A0A7R9FLD1_9NEOP|nr:unnamed protein product [Timema tahoe]